MSAAENDIAALEEDLKQALAREEYLDAVDLYETIESKGWIQARHLFGWGECLVKLRRKQDARQTWIRAYQMDGGYQPVIKALDENFPGWKRSIPAARPAAPAAAPSPAARGPIDESDILFEESAPPTPRPSAPPRAPQTQSRGPAAQPSRLPPASAAKSTYSEAEINWRYVLEDVAEGRAAAESRALQDAAN